MAQSIQLKIKSSILDRDRLLTIHPDYIEFDDKDLLTAIPTRFNKSEIIGWRHGVKGIKGYHFNIGRVYCIDIKNSSDEIIKLRLKSIYRVRKKLLYKKYLTIENLLWGNYFDDIGREYINKFANKIEFTLLGTTINQEGIRFPKDTEIISWFDLSTKKLLALLFVIFDFQP